MLRSPSLVFRRRLHQNQSNSNSNPNTQTQSGHSQNQHQYKSSSSGSKGAVVVVPRKRKPLTHIHSHGTFTAINHHLSSRSYGWSAAQSSPAGFSPFDDTSSTWQESHHSNSQSKQSQNVSASAAVFSVTVGILSAHLARSMWLYIKSRGFEDPFNAVVSPALVPSPLLVTHSEGTVPDSRPLKRGPTSSSAIALKLLASHAQSEHNPLHSFPTSLPSNSSKKHHVAQESVVEHEFLRPLNQSGVLHFSATSKIHTHEPIQVKSLKTITTRRVVKLSRSRRRKFILAKAPVTQSAGVSTIPQTPPQQSQFQASNETPTPHVSFAEPLLKTMPAKTLPKIFSQLETVTESFSKLSSDMLILNANLFSKSRTTKQQSARSNSKSQRISPALESLQNLLQYMQHCASKPPTFQDTQYLRLLKKAADAGSVFAKYNLAVCLVQLGELDVAIALFGDVMSRAEPGSRMYEDAKFNLRVLVA